MACPYEIEEVRKIADAARFNGSPADKRVDPYIGVVDRDLAFSTTAIVYYHRA